MSQIDIRDVVTKSDLKTLEDIQSSGLAEYGESYDSMTSEWQKRLDKKISAIQNEAKFKISDFTSKMAEFTKWGLGVIFTLSVLVFTVTSCFNHNIETEKQRAANGYISFSRKSGEQPIVGAPTGVTLISLSLLGNESENRTIQYTLNLPKLPKDKVYSVAYEIIYGDKVIDSGVSLTEIGQSGVIPFSKERDLSKYISRNDYSPEWFRVSVKVVDAG